MKQTNKKTSSPKSSSHWIGNKCTTQSKECAPGWCLSSSPSMILYPIPRKVSSKMYFTNRTTRGWPWDHQWKYPAELDLQQGDYCYVLGIDSEQTHLSISPAHLLSSPCSKTLWVFLLTPTSSKVISLSLKSWPLCWVWHFPVLLLSHRSPFSASVLPWFVSPATFTSVTFFFLLCS